MVWCNALTEYSNAMEETKYSLVYRYNGAIVRDATNATACDKVKVNSGSKGFRLPTSMEWELAARCIDGSRWTPGNYPSGADGVTSFVGTVAWYSGNSNLSTHSVGTKKPNALGVYDMTGNVYEWCFDVDSTDTGIGEICRVIRGGCYDKDWHLQLGDSFSREESGEFCGLHDVGFRIVKTL